MNEQGQGGYPQYQGGYPQQGYGTPAGYGPQQGYAPPQGGVNPPEYAPPGGYGVPQGGYGIPQGYGSLAGYEYQAGGAPQGYDPMQQMNGAGGQMPGVDAPYGMNGQPYGQPPQMQQMVDANGLPMFDLNGQPIWQSVPQPEQPDSMGAAPAMPPAGFPEGATPIQRPKPRVKLTLTQVLVILVALGFMCWFIYDRFSPEAARYGQIESGSLSAVHEGDVVIARNEIPFDAEGVTNVEYIAPEGAYLAAGQPVCKIYSAGFSANETTKLLAAREEVRDHQKKMLSEADPIAEIENAMDAVITRGKELRTMMKGTTGSLSNLEDRLDQAIQTRQNLLINHFAENQKYSRFQDDVLAQEQRIASWTKDFQSTYSGIISFYVDGYEYHLTGQTVSAFSPAQVRRIINGEPAKVPDSLRSKTTIYRVVQDGEWYVLFLAREKDWDPISGQSYQLKLGKYDTTQVTATVESYTRSGGELLIRLRVEEPVASVLYTRVGEASLGENMDTFRVPQRAMYVQDGMPGVVVVDGQTESFIPVNEMTRENGYVYFTPKIQNLLYVGMTVKLF